MINAHEIERTNLSAHVSLCEERYQSLAAKLDQVEDRLSDLDQSIRSLHAQLEQDRLAGFNAGHRVRDAVILVLVGVVGYLINQAGIF
jgi:chromosome segregation ATPase